jgi:hypothetical protein
MKNTVFLMALLASVASFNSAFACEDTEEKVTETSIYAACEATEEKITETGSFFVCEDAEEKITETGSYAAVVVSDDSEIEKTEV